MLEVHIMPRFTTPSVSFQLISTCMSIAIMMQLASKMMIRKGLFHFTVVTIMKKSLKKQAE